MVIYLFTLLVACIRKRKKGKESKSFIGKLIKTKESAKIYLTAILLDLILLVLLSVVINVMIMTGVMDRINASIAGIVSTQVGETPNPEETPYDWDFVYPSPTPQPGQGGGGGASGGLQFVDRKVQFRYDLVELIKNSIDKSVSMGYGSIEPGYILGVMSRETGATMYNDFDSSGLDSLFDGLVIHNPVCTKTNCSVINKGVSHFIGGTVSGKTDNGDPYRQVIDFKRSASEVSEHAVGYVQYERPYVYSSHMRFVYPQTTAQFAENVIDRRYMEASDAVNHFYNDATLGFIRPNICYIPDVIYNCVIDHGKPFSRNDFDPYIPKIAALDEKNQKFIYFAVRGYIYYNSTLSGFDYSLIDTLINLVNSGKVTYLGDMCKSDDISKYWNSSKMYIAREAYNRAITYMQSEYNIMPNRRSSDAMWFGLAAAAAGEVGYSELLKVFDTAEKKAGSGQGGGAVAGALGSVENMVALCERELAYDLSINDPGGIKYKKFFYKNPSWAINRDLSWCAMFVTYIFHNNGCLDVGPGGADRGNCNFASTGGWMRWSQGPHGQAAGFSWHSKNDVLNGNYTPSAGDIIVYGKKGSTENTQHIGCVVGASGSGASTTVTTIEGNTSRNGKRLRGPNGSGSTDRKASRTINYLGGGQVIYGFIHYDWSKGAKNYTIVDKVSLS